MFSKLLGFLTKILLAVVFYATPVIGFWLASSLEAYLGGPAWMAWTAGALLFPIIPGFWELHTWAYQKPGTKAWLTPLDRLSLKTFFIGFVFICGLIGFFPQAAFPALSTRGDWMLDGINDARADKARHFLFAVAGGLEGVYRAAKPNPSTAQIDADALKTTNEATQERVQEEGQKEVHEDRHEQQIADQKESEKETDKVAQKETPKDEQKVDGGSAPASDQDWKLSKKWPWKNAKLHPVVANMPASAETSIKSVAQYISQREKDPVLRIKALHDWVADRIAYDSVAYYSGNFPSQSAKTVFKTRKGVCAGYANLLTALGRAMNEEVCVVLGDARDSESTDKLSGDSGHAWNAARINGSWYLIDVCWDAGFTTREKGFTKEYRTDYLLTPPEVMIQSHFPEKANWQLLGEPITLGDFLRKPMLDPAFQASNLSLVRPTRAINETNSEAVAIVKNPDRRWLMVGLEQNDKNVVGDSDATDEKYAKLERKLPGKGKYRLNIYSSENGKYSHYHFVGAIDFVNR
ncbi:MAG: transglutaminase [Cyanobacteria bacterium PR.3.49]|nr:transglutaminase [Cyanobacteria bacterium PR.3.49]